MKYLFLLILIAKSFPSLGAGDCNGRYLEDQFEVQEQKNIFFGNNTLNDGSSKDLYMNVYTPIEELTLNRPLLIYMHGGSFTSGDRDMYESTVICKALAKKGYVTASIDYRLEPSFVSLIFPEIMIKAVIRAVQDAKAAVRYFRKDVIENGNTYGVDPGFIFIGGCSAGSIAALHLAYLDDLNELDEEFTTYVNQLGGLEGESGNSEYSSSVNGVINVSGAIKELSFMNNNQDIPVLSIHSPGDLAIPYISGSPYFIPTLPIVQGSKRIHEQALRQGISSELYTIPGFVHIPYGNSPESLNPIVFDSSIVLMSRFLYDNLECSGTTPVKDPSSAILHIYPNPSSSGVYIETNSTEQHFVSARLINCLGQVIREIRISSDKEYLSFEGIMPGPFFLQIIDKKGYASGVYPITVL